jgi:hypothetical protein
VLRALASFEKFNFDDDDDDDNNNNFSSCRFRNCTFIEIVISNFVSRITTCKGGLMKWLSVETDGNSGNSPLKFLQQLCHFKYISGDKTRYRCDATTCSNVARFVAAETIQNRLIEFEGRVEVQGAECSNHKQETISEKSTKHRGFRLLSTSAGNLGAVQLIKSTCTHFSILKNRVV